MLSARIKDRLDALGLEDIVRLDLPLKSRNPNRILRRIRFTRGILGYWILLCRGLTCYACGFTEEPKVSLKHVIERDVLSDLRHRVPTVIVECCGEIVGRGVWDGSRIVLDRLDCQVEVYPDRVLCDSIVCEEEVVECVRRCFSK